MTRPTTTPTMRPRTLRIRRAPRALLRRTVTATAPLRGNPRYLRYFLAGLISSAGTAMATGAVAAAVLQAGGGASGVAMVFLGQMTATLVMLPVGGTLADRLPRVRLIVTVELLTARLIAVQTGLIATGHAQVLNLSLIAAAVSVATSFSSPARAGLVKGLVPAEQLPQANALAKLGHYTIIMTGPGIGGLVMAGAGPAWGAGINAVSFCGSGLLMATIAAPPVHERPRRFVRDLIDGWALITGRRWIAVIVAADAVVVSCWHVAYGIAGLTYVQTEHGGTAAWGLIASSLGVGMVVGSLITLAWPPRRPGYANSLGTIAMTAPGVCMAAAAPLPIIAVAVSLAAIGISITGITWRSLIQQQIPDAQQGRVTAWTEFGQLALTPIAYLLVGPVVSALGLRWLVLTCAVGILLAALAPLAYFDVRRLTLNTPGQTAAANPIPRAARPAGEEMQPCRNSFRSTPARK